MVVIADIKVVLWDFGVGHTLPYKTAKQLEKEMTELLVLQK